MATRFEIERAVLRSDLAPGCRHLIHVLCVRIDAQAGVILAAYQPSLTDLARDTGRDRRTIQRYLNVVEKRGWVVRNRPPPELARRQHRRTAYEIRIPDYPQARDGMPPELGTTSRRARDGMPPELGTTSPEARGTVPRRSSESSTSSIDVIIKTICEKTGATVTPEWAERVREQILGARDIRHPEAYLRRVIAAAPPDTYIPHEGPRGLLDEGSRRRAAEIRKARGTKDEGLRTAMGHHRDVAVHAAAPGVVCQRPVRDHPALRQGPGVHRRQRPGAD